MDDLAPRLDAEERHLLQKLTAIRAVKAAYGIAPIAAEGVALSIPTPAKVIAVTRPARSFEDRIDKFGSYGKAVIDAAVTNLLLFSPDHPVPTRDMLMMIERDGVPIRGTNKINALSALLARSSRMKGHGRSGWSLRVETASEATASTENGHPAAEPPGVPDDRDEGVAAPSHPQSNP